MRLLLPLVCVTAVCLADIPPPALAQVAIRVYLYPPQQVHLLFNKMMN